MAAFGAELISVPSSSDGGGMEAARDLAAKMQVAHCLELLGLYLHVATVAIDTISCRY